MTCRDNSGNPVDWFAVYKLPRLSSSSSDPVRNGVGQAYMDVNSQKWTMLDKGIDDTDHAVYFTLQQIYKNALSQSTAYLMYNDQVPDGPVSFNHGHTKGDIAFDRTSGFWLVHSVPRFPPPGNSSYKYPRSGTVYGQTLLCVTFGYKQFNEIGNQLLYNYPRYYDHNLPSSFAKDNPFLADSINGAHVKSEPFNRTVTLTSLAGRQFVSFAKFSAFGEDLYHEMVAPYFNSELLTETWQHGSGKMASDCSKPKVLNVRAVSILTEDFQEMEDHSKWAVTTSGPSLQKQNSKWTCIGDINRMQEQTKRAGGTLCSNLEALWNGFRNAVTEVEKCDS